MTSYPVEAACFLYKNGIWHIGEWYHRDALYEFMARHFSNPSNEIELISISRPDREPFQAYFSIDEDRIFFIESSAKSTEDCVFISLTLPVI